ncbi:MAG: DUF4242 domain-containing protein [Flavisolibacter sp.]|nr:DUF4242 domain-containing protein [Flavisolibacter sp.]MBD0376513.1 DUF4242 domain-containing protein [Flavisolibacter sp.]
MPLYMDLHKGLKGIKPEEVEQLHLLDVQVQDKYNVKYHKFWVNEEEGTVFCLIEGPDKESCAACHNEAHGSIANEIIEIQLNDLKTLMGPANTTPGGTAVHRDGKPDSAVRTFLFTDIVGSTSLTERYGDLTGMAILHKHNEIVRASIQKNNGTEVKHTGDGIMAVFISAVEAVCSAVEIQNALNECRQNSRKIPLHVRIGINAGEPVTEGSDFFGAAVQLTKRICDVASPDQILISEVVKELCMDRNFQMKELEAQTLKGFSQPVKTFLIHGY